MIDEMTGAVISLEGELAEIATALGDPIFISFIYCQIELNSRRRHGRELIGCNVNCDIARITHTSE